VCLGLVVPTRRLGAGLGQAACPQRHGAACASGLLMCHVCLESWWVGVNRDSGAGWPGAARSASLARLLGAIVRLAASDAVSRSMGCNL